MKIKIFLLNALLFVSLTVGGFCVVLGFLSLMFGIISPVPYFVVAAVICGIVSRYAVNKVTDLEINCQ